MSLRNDEAFNFARVQGCNQITHLYLLALAVRRSRSGQICHSAVSRLQGVDQFLRIPHVLMHHAVAQLTQGRPVSG